MKDKMQTAEHRKNSQKVDEVSLIDGGWAVSVEKAVCCALTDIDILYSLNHFFQF